jgi:hypothetical protein
MNKTVPPVFWLGAACCHAKSCIFHDLFLIGVGTKNQKIFWPETYDHFLDYR